SVTIISTDSAVELACVFEQVSFFQAFLHNGDYQFNIIFIEDRLEAVNDRDHIGSGEEDFVFHLSRAYISGEYTKLGTRKRRNTFSSNKRTHNQKLRINSTLIARAWRGVPNVSPCQTMNK